MAEEIYGYCDSKCKHPVYSKDELNELMYTEEQFQKRIKTITGSVTLTANTSDDLENGWLTNTTATISYPEGFTKDNCIVLDFSTTRDENSRGWNSGALADSSTLGIMAGAIPTNVSLRPNEIKLQFDNYSTTTITIYYKLTLFKVVV